MKQLLKSVLPHGLVRALQTRQERGYARSRVAILEQQCAPVAVSYEAMVAFLVARGVDETQIREGSMPADSLQFLASYLPALMQPGQPLRGLHIGNFLGVSLVSLTAATRALQLQSVVVAIDPNLEHRGIAHPQDHVCALIEHFQLSSHVLLCCGFSDEKNVGNDGRNYLDDYRLLTQEEIAQSVAQSFAPRDVISQLRRLQAGPFDFALVDGNHESSYVRQELNRLHPLLRPGGYVFMDDVSEGWPMIKQLFETSESDQYHCLASNGRVGILQATPS